MNTELLNGGGEGASGNALERAAELLRGGELVAFPTETVYGLGADALNPAAIERVFAAKGRPQDNPLIVHVPDLEGLFACAVLDVPARERVERLAAAFFPGPLTVVVPSVSSIPLAARAGLPTVALRIPDHQLALALLRLAGPLVAPSANRSGRPSPTTAQHVLDDLGGSIAAVLDGGPCRVGIESTVLDLSADRPAVLRPGNITAAAIEAVLGESLAPAGSSGAAPKAPGMKYRHYAPAASVRLVIADVPPDPGEPDPLRLILTTERHRDVFTGHNVRPLEAGTLYALFREADALRMREVLVYAAPGELDAALLDRVRKASEEL